jgi:hypothetical protein
MKEIKPPTFIPNNLACVFLAGSIEMGAAEKWQDKAVALLAETGYVVLNPRRDDWDSSWKQEIMNPKFFEQVNWELQGIEEAEWVLMYFDPNTKSPITLLELGLVAQMDSKKLIVVCPEGFWRKGNVDVICDRYRIKTATTIEEALHLIPRA